MISAGGVAIPVSTTDLSTAPLQLVLSPTQDAERVGRAIVARVEAASSRPADDDAVEQLAALAFFFESIARRVPAFHVFMDELVGDGREADVMRILELPGRRRRGRPREFPSVIALIERVRIEHPDLSVARVIALIDEKIRGKAFPGMPSAARMRNVYSKFRTLFAHWSQSHYVPGEILTARPWRAPGEQEALAEQLRGFVVTRLPGAVVVHAPGDRVCAGPSERARDDENATAKDGENSLASGDEPRSRQ